MRRFIDRSILIAAAGIIALPLGGAIGQEQAAIPEAQGPTVSVPQVRQMVPCGKRTEVIRMLREQFGEGVVAHGLAHSGAVAELFTGPNGTWTIVATSPDGMSCMVGAGQSWQPVVASDDTI